MGQLRLERQAPLKVKKARSKAEQALCFCCAHGQVQAPEAKWISVTSCTAQELLTDRFSKETGKKAAEILCF